MFFGALDRKRISTRRGTEKFTEGDYDLLNLTLRKFRTIATTPNILTEVNSFINNLSEPDRSNCYKILAAALDEEKGSSLLEVYSPSKDIASSGWPFAKYGLTDCGIAEVANNEYLVLTNDFKVASYLNEKGVDTISFVHLKYGQ
ncbi:MAG: hypothetical protein WA885_19000 [Phormidesmis sp.]